MKRILIVSFFILFLGTMHSIGQDLEGGFTIMGIVVNGDTVLMMNLPQVIIKDKRTFKSKRHALRYNRLIRNVKKVYPYSQVAAGLLKKYNDQLALIDDPKKRRKLMKKAEKELYDQYGDELKNLTMSQGIVLIKLIDRETGNTSYELVKDLRGSFSAFLWQSLARFFHINLKTKYDAEGQDQMIEDIVLLIKRGEI